MLDFQIQFNEYKTVANISKKSITFYDKVVCNDEYTCNLIFSTFSKFINAPEDAPSIHITVVKNTDSTISFMDTKAKFENEILRMYEDYIILDGHRKVTLNDSDMSELAFNAFTKFLMTINGGND